jgi:Phage integrase family
LIISSELEQGRSFLPQSFQVNNFIIRSAGLPALPDDADPFESQRADGGVMVFAFGALLEVQHVNLTQESRLLTIDSKRIELEPNSLLVAQSKSGKPRTVPLSAEARRIAEIRIADATSEKYLFSSRRGGGMMREFKTAFVAAVRDAGLEDLRFHDLRHTFASRLNESGADPFVIRDLLGHSTVTMSSDYTQTSSETRQRAHGTLNNVRRRITEKLRKLG